MPNDPTVLAKPDFDLPPDEPLPLQRDARYADIARRLLAGESVSEIAAVHDLTPRRINQILHEPGMRAAYAEARRAILDRLDETLANEKALPIIRKAALATRALTTLAETLEVSRAHMARYGADSKAATVRNAVQASLGALDRTEPKQEDRDSQRSAQSTTLILNAEKIQLIREAIVESGVDLRDVMGETETRPLFSQHGT